MKVKWYWSLLLFVMAGCSSKHSEYFSEKHDIVACPKDSVFINIK